MISKEKRDFLLLFKFIIDVAATVVRDFAVKKTGPDQKTYFCNALHELFHVWDKKKSLCCMCLPGGCSYPRTGKMDSNTFNKIYKFNNRIKMPEGHHITTNGIVQQKCICRYVANSDIFKELDLTDMHFLLVALNLTNPTENDQMVQIMDIRNKVCHAVKTDDFSTSSLSTMWNDLEIAITNLAENAAVKYIKMTIGLTKDSILSETEAEQMMTKIKDLEAEKAKKSTENAEIMKRLEEIKCNNNKQNETVMKELQHLKEGKIKETERHQLVLEILQDFKDSVGEQNVKIDKLTALVSTGFKSLNAAQEANTQMKIDGLPERSESILKKLKKGMLSVLPARVSNSNAQITNVGLGCLLFDLKLDIDTFDNPTKLLSTIKSIFQTVLKMAEVDTSIDRTIKVELMFDDSLTQAQKEIVRGMLSSYAVDAEIVDSSNTKQQVVVTETANADEDSFASQTGQKDKECQTEIPSTCQSCLEKDIQIKKLESVLSEHDLTGGSVEKDSSFASQTGQKDKECKTEIPRTCQSCLEKDIQIKKLESVLSEHDLTGGSVEKENVRRGDAGILSKLWDSFKTSVGLRANIQEVSSRNDAVILGFNGKEYQAESIRRLLEPWLKIHFMKVEYFQKQSSISSPFLLSEDDFVKLCEFVKQLSRFYRLVVICGPEKTWMRQLTNALGSEYKHRVIMTTGVISPWFEFHRHLLNSPLLFSTESDPYFMEDDDYSTYNFLKCVELLIEHSKLKFSQEKTKIATN